MEGSVPRWLYRVDQGVQGEEPFSDYEQHAFSGIAVGEGCAFGKSCFGKDKPTHPEGLGRAVRSSGGALGDVCGYKPFPGCVLSSG